MVDISPTDWDAAQVRKWLDARIAAARSDQVVAERGGYGQQDDCDKATAEEMVCTVMQAKDSAIDQQLSTRIGNGFCRAILAEPLPREADDSYSTRATRRRCRGRAESAWTRTR